MDWVILLQESRDDSVLSETLSAIPKDVAEPADAPSACCALAAAETVAALLGRADANLPEEVVAWGRNRSVTPELVREAQRSASGVLSKSERRELWEEYDCFEE